MALIPLDAAAADRIGAALHNYAEDAPTGALEEVSALADQFDALSDELSRESGTTFAVAVTVEVRA